MKEFILFGLRIGHGHTRQYTVAFECGRHACMLCLFGLMLTFGDMRYMTRTAFGIGLARKRNRHLPYTEAYLVWHGRRHAAAAPWSYTLKETVTGPEKDCDVKMKARDGRRTHGMCGISEVTFTYRMRTLPLLKRTVRELSCRAKNVGGFGSRYLTYTKAGNVWEWTFTEHAGETYEAALSRMQDEKVLD